MAETESRIAAIRSELINDKAQVFAKYDHALFLLDQAEEEIRQLRLKAAEVHIEFFTEEEAAARLKVSPATLSRYRKEIEGFPFFRMGDLVRYSSANLVEIAELLRRREQSPRAMRKTRISRAA